jgi:AdoMet-dependent heme synthase
MIEDVRRTAANLLSANEPQPGLPDEDKRNYTMTWDLDKKPMLVFWETTKACDLSCKHCRAEAISEPLPGELSHEQGLSLIDQIVQFGKPYPVLIMTGGDVLRRKNLFELIAYARRQGIHLGLSPSATPLLTAEVIDRLQAAGVGTISLSLDGARPETHDQLRGVDGAFARTVQMIRHAVRAGLTVQINSTVMASNLLELPSIFSIIADAGAQIWEVFFLIHTGRGTANPEATAAACESVCHFLYHASHYDLIVRTVEAPFFRRIVTCYNEGTAPPLDALAAELVKDLRERLGPPRQAPTTGTARTRDGRGIVFVSHNGEVTPSGFLPVSVGNVLRTPLKECYQDSELMNCLRNNDKLTGRCGLCTFRDLCGGSRARAFASTGNLMAEDPSCAYDPRLAPDNRDSGA